MRKLEFYPNKPEKVHPFDLPPYYIEFSTWDDQKWTWQLFRRQYICTRETYDQAKASNEGGWLFPEVHPWNLGEGELVREEAISLNTRKFLQYMVDALNEKASRELPPQVSAENQAKQ